MNMYLKSQPIKELYLCYKVIIKIIKGTVNILPAEFLLVDHEFTWTWPLIRFYRMLREAWHIVTADFNFVDIVIYL